MDAFANRLMIFAKECEYTDVTAVEYKKEAVLQSFVSGLEDSNVRQRILEKDVVNLQNALESAEILKLAKRTLKAQLRRLIDRTQEMKKVP